MKNIAQMKKYKTYILGYFILCAVIASFLIFITYCAEVGNYEWGIEEYTNGRLIKQSEIQMVKDYLSDPFKVKGYILLDKTLSVFGLMVIMHLKLFKLIFFPLIILLGIWFYKRVKNN